MINKLMINEISPDDEDVTPTIEYSEIFEGEQLDNKIHDFFERHISRSFKNAKIKNLKFNNFNSTIFSSARSLLKLENFNLEDDFRETFLYHSKIITKKLADNIHKNVTNPFLFIILDYTYEGQDILCLIKMEKFFGVQYTNRDLRVQLDMLPDVKTDLQKCAFIFKSQIESLTENDFRNNNDEDTDIHFHSKILDRQDENISKYFMTSFMESYVMAQDKEITKLTSKHLTNELSKYLNIESNKSDLKNYVNDELQKRKTTSVGTLVTDVINNSNLININKIYEENLDNEKLTLVVFEKMQNENSSAYQEFTASPDFIEKIIIKDIESNGRDIKITIAKVCKDSGVVTIDDNDNDVVTITIQKDKIDLSM